MEKVMARELASDIEDIARTIAELALPGMRPKDLVDAVRKKHAAASKRNMSGRLLRGYSGR
ncbi:hypothetical protein DEA98_28760 (plasmid) [Brucella pseudogrignonensis]|nr:hypothetical protein [Brucella pseudogrignonensis]